MMGEFYDDDDGVLCAKAEHSQGYFGKKQNAHILNSNVVNI